MKKTLLVFALIFCINTAMQGQNSIINPPDLATIGYFSPKKLIEIKGRILKIDNYNFLEITIDDELYTNDYESSDTINFIFHLSSNDNDVTDYVSLSTISNHINERKVHLIFLNENDIDSLKQNQIKEIEVSLGFSTKYNFKYIKDINFFKNNLN